MWAYLNCAIHLRNRVSFRFLSFIFVLFAAVGASGCVAMIGAEVNNRGGFVDQKLDERWLVADTKQMRVLRAYVMIGSALRMAETKYASERKLIVAHSNTAIKVISDAYYCAYSQPGKCVYFDERMAEAELAVLRLVIAVLSKKEDEDLLGALTTQLAESMPWLKGVNSLASLLDAAAEAGDLIVNVPKLIKAFIKVGQVGYVNGRRIGALYRDSMELGIVTVISSLDTACAIKTGSYVSYASPHRRQFASYSDRYQRQSLSAEEQWALDNFYGSPDEIPDGVCAAADKGRTFWQRGAGDLATWKAYLDETSTQYSHVMIPNANSFIQASDLVWRSCDHVTSDPDELSDCIGRVSPRTHDQAVNCAAPFDGTSGEIHAFLSTLGRTANKCRLILYEDTVRMRADRQSRSDARLDYLSDHVPSPSHPTSYYTPRY